MNTLIEKLIEGAECKTAEVMRARYLTPDNTIEDVANATGLGVHALRAKLSRYWQSMSSRHEDQDVFAIAEAIRTRVDPEKGIELDDLMRLFGEDAHQGHRTFLRDFIGCMQGYGFDVVKMGAKSCVVSNALKPSAKASNVVQLADAHPTARVHDVIDALKRHASGSTEDQLVAAFKAMGENGQMAILRFGLNRDGGKTLGAIATKYSRTRERVRQICVSAVNTLLRAEASLGSGPLDMLMNACQASVPEGSGKIDKVESILACCAIEHIPVDGAYSLLSAMHVPCGVKDGQYYIMDPAMSAANFAYALKRRERVARAKPKRPVSQIMLVGPEKQINILDRMAKEQEISRGELIAQELSEDYLNSVEPVPVEWSKVGNTWKKGSLRIESEQARMIRNACVRRDIRKVNLMCGIVARIVAGAGKPGRKAA